MVIAACALTLAMAASQLAGQAPAPALQVLAREGRRSIPIITSTPQEMVALDDLAAAFQLNVRDDGGAITVEYRGKSIVLTPDQTIASVAGRLISLPVAPVRSGNRWLLPLDFVTRAIAPIYDSRLELRRASRLVIVGDLRVPRVTVRHEALGTSARVTFELMPAAPVAVSQQGERLLVRIEADALDLTVPAFQSTGYISAIHSFDATSIALELGPRFSSFRSTTQPIDNGTRVTVDVVGAQTDQMPTAVPPVAASPTELPTLTAAAGLRTVAIDAGHGGTDGGAKGVGGTLEKDLTLAVARRLRTALEARLGMRVIMTRDDDREVAIESRSAVANNNKADLFVSLHANASFRPEVTGAVVYVAAFTEADLSREGLTPERLPVFGGGLRGIEIVPWNLAQIPHREQSDRFAQVLADSLNGRVPVAPRAIEHAPLRVLESANMPAVLLEMGYLTNADQEKLIASSNAQNVLAQALLDAIVRFRDRTALSAGGAH